MYSPFSEFSLVYEKLVPLGETGDNTDPILYSDIVSKANKFIVIMQSKDARTTEATKKFLLTVRDLIKTEHVPQNNLQLANIAWYDRLENSLYKPYLAECAVIRAFNE